VGKAVTSFSTLLITIIVAREFGSAYGNIVAILTFVGLFFIFVDFGINAIAVKELVGDKEKERLYFRDLLGLRIVIGFLTIVLALAILSFTPHPGFVKLGIILALPIVVLQGLFFTSGAIFQARERFEFYVIADVLGALVTLSGVFLVVQGKLSLLFVILAYLGGSVVRALVASYLASSLVGQIGVAFNREIWSRLLRLAFPVGLILFFSALNANLDKQIVFLADYRESLNISGEEAAAIYGLAYRMFEIAIVLPTFILNSAYPIMVLKKREGLDALLKFARKLALGSVLLGVFGLILGIIFTPQLVGILWGSGFEEVVPTARILFIGFPIFFLTPILLWLLVVLDRQITTAFIYAVVTLFNLASNIFLVPRLGYNAAAFITILSEALILLLSFGAISLVLRNQK
jgi:O-antigen/teichoic acid export membrane protein